jgi:hypothetical protein
VKHSAELQTAIYTALNGEITGTVHDELEPETAAPYTVIGEGTEQPNDTHSDDGSDETVTLHVWDNATGTKRVKQIAGEIDEVLHHARLVLSSGAIAFVTREFVEILKDEEEPGKLWRHAVMRYRARIQEAP